MSKIINFFKKLPTLLLNSIRKPAIYGMMAGVAAVIVAIVMLVTSLVATGSYLGGMASLNGTSTGTHTSYSYYGGDAYTGIQQAAADTSRNVRTQTSIIIDGFTALPGVIANNVPNSLPGQATMLLFIGLGMTFYFLNKILEEERRTAFENKILTAMSIVPAAEAPVAEEETVAEETDDEVEPQI